MAHNYNLSTQGAETGGSWVRGESRIHSEFKASLGYIAKSYLSYPNQWTKKLYWLNQSQAICGEKRNSNFHIWKLLMKIGGRIK
jgi:hypothetical protein